MDHLSRSGLTGEATNVNQEVTPEYKSALQNQKAVYAHL